MQQTRHKNVKMLRRYILDMQLSSERRRAGQLEEHCTHAFEAVFQVHIAGILNIAQKARSRNLRLIIKTDPPGTSGLAFKETRAQVIGSICADGIERRLVDSPELWAWNRDREYACGKAANVKVNDWPPLKVREVREVQK